MISQQLKLSNELPSQEEFNQFFDSLMQGLKTEFLCEDSMLKSKTSTSRYQVNNSDNKFVYDISYGKKPHFWFSYNQCFIYIRLYFRITYKQTQKLMEDIVHNRLGLSGVTPECPDILHTPKLKFYLDE